MLPINKLFSQQLCELQRWTLWFARYKLLTKQSVIASLVITDWNKLKRKTEEYLRYCIHISWSGKTFHNLRQLYFDSFLDIYFSLTALVRIFFSLLRYLPFCYSEFCNLRRRAYLLSVTAFRLAQKYAARGWASVYNNLNIFFK